MSAKERIIEAAYALFSRLGTRAVGVDAVIERSGVAKMTLYRHYRSKQDLVLAFLERREQLWTLDWLGGAVRARTLDPRGRLLAVFDVFHDWFQSADFEGCPFINVLLEYQSDNKIHIAAADHLARIRAMLREWASEAGIADVDSFVAVWHMLMNGSIIAACAGNRNAAAEARRAAMLVLKGWPE
jgi:AcrR family transcriptional regulator